MAGHRELAGEHRPKLLFTFKMRVGEEWPEDEANDSDYVPNADEDDGNVSPPCTAKSSSAKTSTVKKKKKKKKKKRATGSVGRPSGARRRPAKRRRASPTDSSDGEAVTATRRAPARRTVGTENGAGSSAESAPSDGRCELVLPPELLLHVFRFAAAAEGTVPFLHRAARVCRLWHRTACHPSLWHRVDLSYGWVRARDSSLSWLARNRLSAVRELSLASWKKLSLSGIEILAQNCSLLHTINLSYCIKVNAAALRLLTDQCCHLANWDLSHMAPSTVSCGLKYILDVAGDRLTHLNISGNLITGFTALLNSMCDRCPLLELLDLCNIVFVACFVSLNIPRMQCGWPRLRILRLSNLQFSLTDVPLKMKIESPGFPVLEELSVTDAKGSDRCVNDDFLSLVLKSSHALRLLDVRGCSVVSPACLRALPLPDLRYLYLSRTAVSRGDSLAALLCKWQHSLRELDLSWTLYPAETFDTAMQALLGGRGCPDLHTVDLTGTAVSRQAVTRLLACCPRLASLNLTSCRGLPRGTKRNHRGVGLANLQADIDVVSDSD